MILLPVLLALIIGTTLVGIVTKLAMMLTRRYALGWRHGFAYGALVTLAGMAGLLLRFFSGAVLPLPLGAAVAFIFHALLGGWFLGTRARGRDGQPLGFRRGMLLGLMIFVLVLAMGFVLGMLQGVLEVQRGTLAPI